MNFLSKLNIYDDNEVVVVLVENSKVKKISYILPDLQIDTIDKFVNKSFEELNIIITSLKVH